MQTCAALLFGRGLVSIGSSTQLLAFRIGSTILTLLLHSTRLCPGALRESRCACVGSRARLMMVADARASSVTL